MYGWPHPQTPGSHIPARVRGCDPCGMFDRDTCPARRDRVASCRRGAALDGVTTGVPVEPPSLRAPVEQARFLAGAGALLQLLPSAA